MDKAIKNYLQSKGITPANSDAKIEADMKVWLAWYKGHVEDFHKYSVYNGKEKVNKERKSLNMAGKVCQRWADLLLNEKVEITVADDYTQTVLDALLKQTNFFVRCNNLIERAFAVGGGWMVQYWDGNKVSMKYISQENSLPISYDSGRVTEIAFASEKIINRKKYTYLETHLIDPETGTYVIDNTFLESTKNGLVEMRKEEREQIGVDEKVETGSTVPWFQQIRPNIACKTYFNSPYGTSVFAGAIDILKEVDFVFDSFYKEFLLGKKRIFVPDGTTNIQINSAGEQVETFDPNDEVFYKLPNQPDENDIHECSMDLRIPEHEEGMQTLLNLLSQSVGFGSDGFKWEQSGVTTATAIISQNSEMFRTLKKHEILLESALKDMTLALLMVYAFYTGDQAVMLDADISINFDDSIIEDTAEIKRQAMLELQTGLIDAVEYYQRVYKFTEAQAIEFLETMKARNPVQEEPPLEDE